MQFLLIFAAEVNGSISALNSTVTDITHLSRQRNNLRANENVEVDSNEAKAHVQMRLLEEKTCRLMMYWAEGYFWQEGKQIH